VNRAIIQNLPIANWLQLQVAGSKTVRLGSSRLFTHCSPVLCFDWQPVTNTGLLNHQVRV